MNRYEALPKTPTSKAILLGTRLHQALQDALSPTHAMAVVMSRESDADFVKRRLVSTPRHRPSQQRSKGDKVFGVEEDSVVHRGRVISHRGVEVRIADDKGVVRTFHERYVFND